MSSQSNLLLAADKALKLSDDLTVLGALGKTAGEWKALAAKVDGITSLEALFARIVADANDAKVKQAFADIGLQDEYAVVTAFLAKVNDATGNIPARYRPLLDPLESFPAGGTGGVVDWSLTHETTDTDTSKQYSINLGAEARVGFNAAGKWPGTDPAPARLLQLGASGKVSASAKATLPFAFGSMAAGASGAANAALDYYFAAPNGLYALAVAERLDNLANPFALEDLWQAFAASDLEGIVVGLGGSASANVDVKFANAAVLSSGVGIDLGVTVGVKASLKTTYRLTLRRAGTKDAPVIRATLMRDKADQSSLALNMNLTVDVAALTKPVAAAIKAAVERWDQALAEIKPFLSPGTWLRDNAEQELTDAFTRWIADEDLRKAVITDAKGALGANETDSSAIVGWLMGEVTGAFDTGKALVTDEADEAAKRVKDQITAKLPQLSKYLADTDLTAFIDKQLDSLEADLTTRAKALFKPADTRLTKALQEAGSAINGAVASADDALKRVRDLLNRYDKLFQDILAKAEEAAKSKVTARLFVEESRLEQTVLEVVGDFLEPTPQARGVFEDLTRGRLQKLVSLFESGEDVPGFHLVRESSRLKRFSLQSGGQGYEVAFLNIANLSFAELLSNKTAVVVDGLGNVQVDLEAKLDKTLSLLTTRAVSMVETSALVYAAAAARNPDAPSPSVQIGLGARFADDKMSWTEVKQFVTSLADAGLLPATAVDAAQGIFQRWSPSGGAINGEIAANLSLSDESLRTLLQLPDRFKGDLNAQARSRIVSQGLSALYARKAIDTGDFERGARVLADRANSPANTTLLQMILEQRAKMKGLYKISTDQIPNPSNTKFPPGVGASWSQNDYFYFLKHSFGLDQLVAFIDAMGDIYQPPLAANGAPLDSAALQRHYEAAQDRLLNAGRFWLVVAENAEYLINANVSRRTATFMRLIADLAGLPKGSGVRLTLSRRLKKDAPLQVEAVG